ncbi:MAG: hypothetical protein AAFX76_11660 [Planctomycetota bacterium]
MPFLRFYSLPGSRFRGLRFAPAFFALALLSGCHDHKLYDAQRAYRVGNLGAAERHIRDYARHNRDTHNTLLAQLEKGHIARAAGDLDASDDAFADAAETLRAIDRSPDVSLSRETLAAFTNLGTLPYRGAGYDRIMLPTLRALNALERGDPETARPLLRRAYERQREAVEANAERLEQARAAAAESSRGASGGRYDAARAQRDPRFRAALSRQYEHLDELRVYAPYVNPFVEWMQGVFFSAEAADGNDLEWACRSFARAAALAPGNRYAAEDAAAAEAVAAGSRQEPMTYVVFATGVAPSRGEVRIDIPLFIFGGNVDYVGANFPRLIYHPNYLRDLTARDSAGESYRTELLADMDAVVSTEFDNELPTVITKTLIAAGTKAAAAYGLREAVRGQDESVVAAVRIATLLYQYAANQADLRAWATLPKQFHIVRLPTPPDGKIDLSAPAQPTATVTLDARQTNVVFVRSINPYSPWRVSQFSLGPATSLSANPRPESPPEPKP